MAQNAPIGVSYFLQINEANKTDIEHLRRWSNLKVAFDKNHIWITNFEWNQIDSIEVKSIPFKTIFYSKNSKLFLQNSLLPERNEPTFLWTPIERAFPLEVPSFNHNYFGVQENISIKLVETEIEKEAQVMLTDLETLQSFIETAPEVRLKNIAWVIVNQTEVLLFGKPILPINGKVFWKNQDAILPVGYDFELAILSEQISNKVNKHKDSWIIWNTDSTYFKVAKEQVKPLTLSSFRKTIKHLENLKNTTYNAT